MITVYILSLVISIVLIVVLFALVAVESATGMRILPHARTRLDSVALSLHSSGERFVEMIERAPASLASLTYFLVHLSAIVVALLARAAERRAHKVADFVSYRRTFVRRETRSDFLKEVSAHKESLEVPHEVLE